MNYDHDLTAKVGSDNTMFYHLMGKHDLGDCYYNGERFVNFNNFHHLVIGGAFFEHSPWHKVAWVSPDRHRTSNEIGHIVIHSRF